jgi:hypothetical protein
MAKAKIPTPMPLAELEAKLLANWKDDIPKKLGRPPIGDKAMSAKEAQRRHRERKRAKNSN